MNLSVFDQAGNQLPVVKIVGSGDAIDVTVAYPENVQVTFTNVQQSEEPA